MRNEVWRKNENSKRFNTILWVKAEKIGSSKMDFIETKKSYWRNDEKRLQNIYNSINQHWKRHYQSRSTRHDVPKIYEHRWDAIIEWWIWWNHRVCFVKKLWFNTKILGYNDDIP